MGKQEEEFTLDLIGGFVSTFQQRASSSHIFEPFFGSLYCPGCGGRRRVQGQVIEESASADVKNIRGQFPVKMLWAKGGGLSIPTTVVLQCLQCHVRFYALIFERDRDLALVLFPDRLGWRGTPNCPEGVAFYLDQAERAHASAAHTAAIAMFRSAAEWLLEDQGFSKGMLGQRLADLERAIESGSGPKWASELERDALSVLKNLGNTAAHTNSGDLSKQANFDAEMYIRVQTVFTYLIEIIYEREKRLETLLAELKKTLP